MNRAAPKFSPGEPVIIQSEQHHQFRGVRAVVMRIYYYPDNTLGYFTLPMAPGNEFFKEGTWLESALRPLPPEELDGCFKSEQEGIGQDRKVSA